MLLLSQIFCCIYPAFYPRNVQHFVGFPYHPIFFPCNSIRFYGNLHYNNPYTDLKTELLFLHLLILLYPLAPPSTGITRNIEVYRHPLTSVLLSTTTYYWNKSSPSTFITISVLPIFLVVFEYSIHKFMVRKFI